MSEPTRFDNIIAEWGVVRKTFSSMSSWTDHRIIEWALNFMTMELNEEAVIEMSNEEE